MVHVLVYNGYCTHLEYDNQDEVYYGKIEGISVMRCIRFLRKIVIFQV